METENKGISLNKFIASQGICSRRQADVLIETGKVSINGEVAKKGNRVFPEDEVTLKGKAIQHASKEKIYLLYNKPPGVVCTTDRREPNNIIDKVNYKERIFPVGRLDKASTGLIILTNDGDLVNKVLRSEHKHEKEYVVTLTRRYKDDFLQKMGAGVPVLDRMTKPCTVLRVNEISFRIILTEGMNRQIRRMCEHLGHKVRYLKRIRIMHMELRELAPGRWRHINSSELKTLFRLTNRKK